MLMAKDLYDIVNGTDKQPTEDAELIAKWKLRDAKAQEALETRPLAYKMQCSFAGSAAWKSEPSDKQDINHLTSRLLVEEDEIGKPEEETVALFNPVINVNNRILDFVLASDYIVDSVQVCQTPLPKVDFHHPPLDICLRSLTVTRSHTVRNTMVLIIRR
ncbi:hypothetical protein QE152_g4210 [Popillia japonica]|uniref:Uncharacterized protein n=1 Tax=Popillia japonica TaxID=7064 RepID=A0AAW1MXC9_POPJA